MLLQVLRPLEGLPAEVAFVRLERHMDTNMRGDVIAFDGGGAAIAPLTGQVEIVGALAANVSFANVILDRQTDRISEDRIINQGH